MVLVGHQHSAASVTLQDLARFWPRNQHFLLKKQINRIFWGVSGAANSNERFRNQGRLWARIPFGTYEVAVVGKRRICTREEKNQHHNKQLLNNAPGSGGMIASVLLKRQDKVIP